MSVYNLNGDALNALYSLSASINEAYDINGNEIFGGGSDYNEWDTEYQHSILIARDEWKTEYRADPTVLPIIIHTDQHGTLSPADNFAYPLFRYLGRAIRWDECSACIGLGDVCDYSTIGFAAMVTCLASIPTAKQINIWGNHDTWTTEWSSDTSVPTAEEWATLQSYFDNSNYNGYHFMTGTKCSQYMIDADRGIKYVVFGGWDYDKSLGGHSHYVIDGTNMESIISMLSAVDNYDIVVLTHIQPYSYNNDGQIQEDGTTTWYLPTTDGRTVVETATYVLEPIVAVAETSINQLLNDRKNKQSGTVYDSYGVSHSYDFTNCTSDLVCMLHGHEHRDRYNYQPHGGYTFPVVLYDSIHYDYHPFFFVNINRTDGVINGWKVDDQANIYRYSIPLEYTE